jgi:hypothetical protein
MPAARILALEHIRIERIGPRIGRGPHAASIAAIAKLDFVALTAVGTPNTQHG